MIYADLKSRWRNFSNDDQKRKLEWLSNAVADKANVKVGERVDPFIPEPVCCDDMDLLPSTSGRFTNGTQQIRSASPSRTVKSTERCPSNIYSKQDDSAYGSSPQSVEGGSGKDRAELPNETSEVSYAMIIGDGLVDCRLRRACRRMRMMRLN